MKEEAKNPLDLFETFASKTPIQTSQGTVYVRRLGNGGWSSISSSNDSVTLGKAALEALTGPNEKPGDEESFPTAFFEKLSSDDIEKLTSAVAQVNRLGDLPEQKSSAEGLGILILARHKEMRNEVQRLIDRARSSTLLGNVSGPELKIQDLKIPDFSNNPVNRAAAASEQAAEQMTEGLLLWKQQLEADKQAAADLKVQAEENIAVAKNSQQIAQKSMWVTIGVAVVTLFAQVGQFFWSERGTAEERAQQAEAERSRHEATLQVLREQLSTQQQLLSTQPHTPLPKNKERESRK